MTFAAPAPAWLIVLAAALAAGLGLLAYRHPASPLTGSRRWVLASLRASILAALVLFLFRPIVLLPPSGSGDAVVPILVDVSRSMRIEDEAGALSRLDRARTLLRSNLLPRLSARFTPEILAVGERLTPADLDGLAPVARRTDLTGALAAARQRYRGRAVPGIVLISDGCDTGQQDGRSGRPDGATISATERGAGGPPLFAIGVGSPDPHRDREVLGVVAGNPRLDQSSIDLHASAVSTGFGRTPFALRLSANGRLLESRRVVPPADGSPIEEVFTVSPDSTAPTVYTVEIPPEPGEAVTENNGRSVLVSPAGRKRRVLVLEGAPGFEHSFVKRALARDPDLEIDSVVRKGRNAEGQSTFFVQAAQDRAPALMTGFPDERESLYAYDALVVANVEGDFFTKNQLAMAADFVSERGGGLLVLGGRSFAAHGLIGTPLEEALPVELNDRRGAAVIPVGRKERPAAAENKLVLTEEGENHPITRIGGSREESAKRWAGLPALAASAPLGGPRRGAEVLAVAAAPGGALRPIVAVQRYGRGRSMVFAGEASWRWKMLVASGDRTHEFFWRQAVRWLAGPSPDPVTISVPDASEPGEALSIDVEARDAAFRPIHNATVEAVLALPAGGERSLKLRRDQAAGDRQAGGDRLTTSVRMDEPGLYRVRTDLRRDRTTVGMAERWFYVGGSDREFTDPRLNEGFLRRMARASGGRYVRAADAARVADWLRDAVPQDAGLEPRDLWHTPWAFAALAALMSVEWVLRRRWGLR